MEATGLIISKCNPIRWADRNGLMRSFDNLLWSEETWATKKGGCYNQLWFAGDIIPLQLKAGLTATVVVTKVGTTSVVLTATTVTTYPTFKVYEYLLTVSALETFYLTAETETKSFISETQEAVATDTDMLLVEWSSNDATKNTYQYDYTTAQAVAVVNFIRIKGELLEYDSEGESTVYDNLNEKTTIQSNYYRKLTLQTERIPRQLAEIIKIAAGLDFFHVNEEAYIAEQPKTNQIGGFVEMTAELTKKISEGIDTDDIGFDLDEIESMSRVQPKLQQDATGTGTFSVTAGYIVTHISITKISGTPTVKIGSTVGGQEIFRSELITATNPPRQDMTMYTPEFNTAWTIYWECSGGVVDIAITTIMNRLT